MSVKSDAMNLLTQRGVEKVSIESYQVLCLPENIETQLEGTALIDSGEGITLSKLLKEENVACANSYDLGLKAKINERRSSEYYLGCIWILEHAALPIVAGVIGRLLSEKILKRSKDDSRDQVQADIKIIDEKLSADIKFSGDVEAFLKMFEGLDNV
jgi:hypothetical protein